MEERKLCALYIPNTYTNIRIGEKKHRDIERERESCMSPSVYIGVQLVRKLL